MKKRFLICILTATVSMTFLSACNKETIGDITQEEEALTVNTIGAEKGTLVISETFMGSVSPERELKIYPKTAGEVTKINVKAGDYVNAGDVLFQLDDTFAQLDLKSAQTSLSRTQAEVKKSQGSDTVLSQQREWQGLENQNSKIADSNYNLNTANEDYNRQLHYLDEAKDKENIAYEDYKKAANKYDKARDIFEVYEGLQAAEPAFTGMTVDVAASMTTASGASQEHINWAKGILASLAGGEDDKLYPTDITSAGVASLKSARESRYNVYAELRSVREGQEDKVTSAKRSADRAGKSLQDDYTTYRQNVDNMLVNDIAVLEDTKRIQQIEVNASSIGVEKAKQSLEQYIVTSPISGVVSKVDIKEYETVSNGTEAILIENTDSMTVEFSVTEKVRSNLSVGQELSVEKDSISASGQVFEISEVPDERSGLFVIKAAIPGTSGIMSGTRVSVTLDSYKDDSGFIVPNDAVYHSNGQEYLFVAENGKAVRRNVKTGLFDADRIVISEGLNAGDRVITSWTSELKEGVKIKENQVKSPVAVTDVEGNDTASGEDMSGDTADVADTDKESAASKVGKEEDKNAGQKRVKAMTTVFVRSAPNADDNGNKLGKAKPGDEFVAVGEENGWTRVIYNDSEAYIKSDYVTVAGNTGEAE